MALLLKFMKRKLSTYALLRAAFLAAALATAPAMADFAAGKAAYDAGNFAAALAEWRPLAESGDPLAQVNLAQMYATGQGVPQEPLKAIELYRLAAEQDMANAQFTLGLIYDEGRGVAQDYAEAARWYRRAAGRGVATAQFNLGVMFEKGQGVPQNYALAYEWYLLAANQGDANARNNLGVLYQLGRGVDKNLIEAHRWFNLAAASGQANAISNRQRIASQLTVAQIATAQALAYEQTAVEEVTGWFVLTTEDIAALQKALAAAGLDPGPIDGKRGPRTESSLAAFQQANGLIIGPPDKASLKALGVR